MNLPLNMLGAVLLVSCSLTHSQDYVSEQTNQVILSNGLVTREISMNAHAISSTRLSMTDLDRSYIQPSREFAFLLDGQSIDESSAGIWLPLNH